MTLLAALWICSLAAAALGWRLGSLSKPRATCCAGLVCSVLVVFTIFAWQWHWLPEILIGRTLALLQGSWFAPFAATLFFIAARQARDNPQRPQKEVLRTVRLLELLAAVIMTVASIGLVDRLSWYGGVASDMAPEPRIDDDNIARQSTGYTCGAAACATLLRRLDIDSKATEQQLAPLCITRRYDGATVLGMAAGLKTIAAVRGWRVRMFKPDWTEFCRLKKPLLASVMINKDTGHAIVVCSVDPTRGVEIADPLAGLYWESEERFRQRFANEAVVVYRGEPFN
ncbi:MAG TPA: cysteine peptidase family C39 domain-containing protein [Planctomycetota bacterium]|nr:cysteine peptidase family C39 domain-containing protein [Planctomycetota bacterium]